MRVLLLFLFFLPVNTKHNKDKFVVNFPLCVLRDLCG